MGKRSAGGGDGAAAFRKRQKTAPDAPTGEDVLSSDHLRSLLAFDQNLRQARHGLQSLKRLLDQIISDSGDRKAKLDILQRYLDAVKPRDTGDDAVFLHEIMDMWSLAAQVGDEGVMSSVAVVLALLLRVVSDSLQLVPHGLGLCQTLLQERQLKSLSKNLSSDKGKAFILSPTLRLLREALCLDGGAYAKGIVRARAHTFAALSRNLELGHSGEGQEDPQKSSVRTNAVRFLLSCLKHLHSEGRTELLSQRDLVSRLTYHIKSDPPHLVLETLDVLQSCVLTDPKIPRATKFRLFNTKTLSRLLALYGPPASSVDMENTDAVGDRAHQFLKYICTTPSAGVLYPYRGLYPKDPADEYSEAASAGRAGDHADEARNGRCEEGLAVHNFVLSEFADKLRPWSSLRHSELLVAIFTAAPELVAKYFYNNRSFTFEPKLSMTWVGYAAFLFDTISIPFPPSFGDPVRYADAPPPTPVLLDHMLPPAINQKVLVRCLSPKSHLTAFFATKILLAALEKLAKAVEMLGSKPCRGNSNWSEAARRLEDAFCQRIPDMRDVVRCYKALPVENSLHKTLASRLLQLYYRVIPRVALAANFDVSPLFLGVLGGLRRDEFEPGVKALSLMELESLVTIASYSPGMRWFSKTEIPGGDASISAFTALLQLLCGGDGDTPFRHLRNVLANVAVENQLVSRAAGMQPLLQALQLTVGQVGSGDMEVVWGFLDNCIGRCAASPIKYLDSRETLLATQTASPADRSSSLLTLALIEQLPFAAAGGKKSLGALSRFLTLYISACQLREGRHRLLEALGEELGRHCSRSEAKLPDLGDTNDATTPKATDPDDRDWDRASPRAPGGEQDAAQSEAGLEEMLHVPPMDAGDTANLTKWTSKSAEDLVEDGWVARLARLLLSEHVNIRKEALTSILKVAARVKASPHEARTQIWLLLSELAESSRAHVEQGPVPSAFVAFAVHALPVLQSPGHPLYAKLNRFLTRGPVWPPDRLPLAHDVLHGAPADDDRYYAELAWLLACLLDGLRAPPDLALVRRKRWLEKLLALGANPYLRPGLRARLLRLVYRASRIDAGSTTLATRFGLLGWLDAQRAAAAAAEPEHAAACAALMRRLLVTCDRDRVAAWSHGGAARLVDAAARRPSSSAPDP